MDNIECFLVCIIILLVILIHYVKAICITNDRNHYERIDRIVRKLDEIIDKLDKIEKDRSN